jgi:transposase InsO family protein
MQDYAWTGVTCRCATKPGTEKRVSKQDSHPDLLCRNFKADKPNKAWFADITYVKTHQGWLYLAIVMDIWSRKIVGWSMDKTMAATLADDALKMAIARRNPDKGCIHHSDHGSQYVSLLLGKTMNDNGITPSMGAIQSPWDNAATESFMGIIKSECAHAKTFANREEAALEIFEYIECFYNKIRIHSALGWMSPNEFEEKMLLAA